MLKVPVEGNWVNVYVLFKGRECREEYRSLGVRGMEERIGSNVK